MLHPSRTCPNGSSLAARLQASARSARGWAPAEAARPVQAPADAFLAGLQSVVPRAWLNLFNQGELQMLIGGGSSEGLDLADLQVLLLTLLQPRSDLPVKPWSRCQLLAAVLAWSAPAAIR